MTSTGSTRSISMPAKLGLLVSLYFAQGLPFGLFTQALPVMLCKHGYSLSENGLASLLAMPWALKFLWAPAVDRFGFWRFGRRKSWIVPLQAMAALVLLMLSASAIEEHISMLLVAVFVLNLVAATQDITTDGMAVDMLSPPWAARQNGSGPGAQGRRRRRLRADAASCRSSRWGCDDGRCSPLRRHCG
jgi:MFS family permease